MMYKNNFVNESLIESVITMTSVIIYIYIVLFIIVGGQIIFVDSKFLKIIFLITAIKRFKIQTLC